MFEILNNLGLMIGDLPYEVPRSNTVLANYVTTCDRVTCMRLVFTDWRQTVPNVRIITRNGVYFSLLIFSDV